MIDEDILTNLNILLNDSDVDVRYYANKSIEGINELSKK